MSARIVRQLIITDRDGDTVTVAKSETEPGALAFQMGSGADVCTVYVDRDDTTTLVRYLTNWLARTAPEPGEDGGQHDAPPTTDEGDGDNQ